MQQKGEIRTLITSCRQAFTSQKREDSLLLILWTFPWNRKKNVLIQELQMKHVMLHSFRLPADCCILECLCVAAAMQMWQLWHQMFANMQLWCECVGFPTVCTAGVNVERTKRQARVGKRGHWRTACDWSYSLQHSHGAENQSVLAQTQDKHFLVVLFIYLFILQLKSVIMSVTLWHFQEPLVAGTASHPLHTFQIGCWLLPYMPIKSGVNRNACLHVYKVILQGAKKTKKTLSHSNTMEAAIVISQMRSACQMLFNQLRAKDHSSTMWVLCNILLQCELKGLEGARVQLQGEMRG